MDTAAKGTGRGAFSGVVGKSFGHFGCPVFKYFTQNRGILKIIKVIEFEKLFSDRVSQNSLTSSYSMSDIALFLSELKNSTLAKNSPSGLESRSDQLFIFSYGITPLPTLRYSITHFFSFSVSLSNLVRYFGRFCKKHSEDFFIFLHLVSSQISAILTRDC